VGETENACLRLEFDPKLRLSFHGATVTSDAGLLAYRELDEAFGLTEKLGRKLVDPRTGENLRHPMTALLRQAVFGRLAGYEDTNDAERLRVDPAMRQVVGGRARDKKAASTSKMGWFETDALAHGRNLPMLVAAPGAWVERANEHRELREVVLDADSSESPVHGEQEGSAYNGYFGCRCYHPLFVFNQFGDVERAMLRPGNVHSATDWEQVFRPVLDRYGPLDIERFFRADAAFAEPELFRELEGRGWWYVMRIKSNAVLEESIQHLLRRPVARPSKRPKVFYHSFRYQAGSWKKARRVIAKIEWHMDELFPKVGFIVTNLRWRSKKVVKFYNKRGTAEQWIKEGKYAINWTRLSCHDFKDNEVRLQLFVLAYNMANFLRQLVLPGRVGKWTLTTLREKLVKIGAKVVRHARCVVFQMAEVAVPRELLAAILARIARLREAPA